MTYRQMMTLGEMTSEVLARSGLGIQSDLTGDIQPQVKAYLREAQRRFWQKYDMLRNRVRTPLTLISGQTLYDIPDQFDPGSILLVSAQSTNGRIWDLYAGISASDRTSVALTKTVSGDEPSRWDINNGQLEVIAAPGPTVTLVYLTAFVGPAPLLDDNERPAFDDEALIGYATIQLKKFKKMIAANEAQADLAVLGDYLADLNADQGTGESFTMGTDWIDPHDVPPYPSRNRPWWLADRRP